jgi:pimeloyl-ACP methyl ester carboxylesterase
MRFVKTAFILMLITGLWACEQISIDATDPFEKAGPYQSAVNNISIDTSTSNTNITATFYSPKGTFSANSLPLVILLPGFSVHYYDYDAYAFHLASHGYIVLGMDYVETSADNTIANHDDKAQQVIEAIDYALTTSIKSGQIDSTKIAAMGHSLGGKIAFYAASQDARIKAIIALDPSNAGGPPCSISPTQCANYPVAANPSRNEIGVVKDIVAASLIFRSQPDATNPAAEFNASYFFYGSDGSGTNGAPSLAFYINMGSASHASYVPKLISVTPALVKRNSIAWLQQIFSGVDNSLYLGGAKMQADITAGRIVGFSSR